MSENMSSDWAQFYHHHPNQIVPPPGRTMFPIGGDGVSDATVVTTATAAAAATAAAGHLSPEGRVSKPVRRRSRASRRTPTTLLNTDTTNFRAMVQQFTGGPSAPFGSSQQLNTQSFSFGMNNSRQAHVNPGAVMVPAASGFQIQYQQQQHHQPPFMFSLGNNSGGGGGGGQADAFFHRLGNNTRPQPPDGLGLVMDDVSSSQLAVAPPLNPSRAPPPSSSNDNRSNTFLF